jgi:hypothetical protein
MEGTGQYQDRIQWWALMGNVETLRFCGVADHISANVDLIWTLYESPSPAVRINAIKAFGNVHLNSGQVNVFQDSIAPTDAGTPASYAYLLICSLSAAAKAHVRIWVTGRGRI